MHRRSTSHAVLAFFATGSAALSFWACSKDTTLPPTASLDMTISPREQTANGASVDVTVLASEANGSAGTGDVVLVAEKGQLGQATLHLSNGQATTKWTCNSATTPSCVGAQLITATWKEQSAAGRVTFTAPGAADAGTSDAGSSDGGADGGSKDAALVQTGILTLSSDKTQIFFQVGDHADLTAKLGTDGGNVFPDAGILFSTDLGGFADPSAAVTDGGTPTVTSTLTVYTNSKGLAVARFFETGAPGTATITASHEPSQSQAQLQIGVTTVLGVEHVSTKCGGSDCTIMGVKGSGFNEQAQVTFRVLAPGEGVPAPGVKVMFSIPNAPLETTVDPAGISDGNGLVTVNVKSGRAVGAFTVKAVVITGQAETQSKTIGIRGAKPSNASFIIKCVRANVEAYISSDQQLKEIPVDCTVKLVDRFNNPVGTGTSVGFKSEAGTIPNDAPTQAYKPNSDNTDEGVGKITFDTLSTARPKDVAPLAALPNQYPFPRGDEPSVQVASLVNNPRDSLVTIIAYVRGEEHYWDLNQNGVYDLGEPFIDQGEPFIDENDNGIHDPTEFFIDAADADLLYTEGDGKWSDNTTIWTETHILYSGLPARLTNIQNLGGLTTNGLLPSPFATPCDGGLGQGQSINLEGWISDVFLNVPIAGSTFAFSSVCSNGTFKAQARGAMLDGYGFEMQRVLLDKSGTASCNQTGPDGQTKSEYCVWKRLFGGFAGGVDPGTATMTGSDPTGGPKACDACTVNLDVVVSSVKTTFISRGGVK
jgi:hypothetical protein